MHPRQSIPDAAVALAATQGQTISKQQLLRAGVSPKVYRRLAGEWVPLGRSVLCRTPPGWLSAVWAGLLVGGDDAALGGLSAAHLYGWLPDPPRNITIWSEVRAEPWAVGEYRLVFRRGDRRRRGRPRRTLPEDTLLDAAGECGSDSVLHLLARGHNYEDERYGSEPCQLLRGSGSWMKG